jgi:hypothetical protein
MAVVVDVGAHHRDRREGLSPDLRQHDAAVVLVVTLYLRL